MANLNSQGKDLVTINYKETTIALKSGDKVTLSVADKKLTEDVIITSVLPEETIEWDGSYTISGGTISFTIDGDYYEAEDGMTWRQWLSSSYNTVNWVNMTPPGGSGYEIGRPYSGSQSAVVTYNEVYVLTTDVIIADAAYGIKIVSGGGGGVD